MIFYETIQQEGILLNANESPYPFSKEILDEIKASLHTIPFHRYPQDDAYELRNAYASYLHLHPDQLIAGNGSDEMIGLLIALCITNGKKVYTLQPDFSMYDYYTEMQGGRVVTYSYGFHQAFDVEDFIQKGKQEQVDMILFSNPNNPSGRVIERASIKAILNAFPKIPVVIDEAYGEFSDQSMLEYLEEYPNLLVLRTMSKAFGMAALRCGFLIACKATMDHIRPYKVPYNVNALTQYIATIVLHHQEEITNNVKTIIKERDRMIGEIQSMDLEQFTIYPSHANYLYGISPRKQDFLQALKERHIVIRNYPNSDAFRISIGTQEENTQVLDIIQTVFKKEELSCAAQI